MKLDIILIITFAVLSLLGWFKSDTTSRRLTLGFIFLTSLVVILNLANVIRNKSAKARKEFAGTLKPESTKLFTSEKNFTNWEFGTNFREKRGTIFRYTAGKPFTQAFGLTGVWWKSLDENFLELDSEDGQLNVSVTVRDNIGEVIAILSRNEWRVNHPAKAMDRNYTKDMLEVIDHRNSVVLQIRLLDDRVQMNGIFYGSNGKGVAVFPHPRNGAGSFVMLDKENQPDPNTLKPLFKYPSDLHLGEFVDNVVNFRN